MARLGLALVLAIASTHGMAARPLVTDDARVLERGHCQVEAFYKEQRNYPGSEFWFIPACNPGIELTVGGNRIDGERNLVVQAKTLIRELPGNGYGLAASAGAFGGHGFANAIASFSFVGERAVVHANAGYFEAPTWGLGLELAFSPRLTAVAETYGQRGEMPTLHYGIRYAIIPERLQLDVTRGDHSGEPATRFYTVGIRLMF